PPLPTRTEHQRPRRDIASSSRLQLVIQVAGASWPGAKSNTKPSATVPIMHHSGKGGTRNAKPKLEGAVIRMVDNNATVEIEHPYGIIERWPMLNVPESNKEMRKRVESS
ncbi:hypothetical protein FRC08_014909, partial [Ceratobasidium sp. 394]